MRKLLLVLVGAMSLECIGWTNPSLSRADDLPASSPPAASSAPLQDLSASPLLLENLLPIAFERNPAIQAAWSAVEAKQSLIMPNKTLPDPTITFQTMGDLIPPTLMEGDPSSARTFGIEQEIPFPGKLGLQGKMAGKETEAALWNYEQVRRRVVADLKQAYFDYYFIHKSLESVTKNKRLLEKFAQIAEAKYRVGQGIQQDVLKAQVEISKLIDRLTVLKQRRGASQARLNTLLFRPPEDPLGSPAELQKAEFRYPLEQLQEMAMANAPELKMQDREIERNQYKVGLAQKQFYPDFSAGFTYFNRDGMPEMYGLMAGAKVPLYFWRKQRPELEGARADLAGAQRQRDNIRSSVSFEIKDAYLAAQASEALIQLYHTGIIPQSTLSLESAVAGYQVGKVDFLTLIDNLVTLLEYELRYHETLTEFQKALAQMEPLVGAELTQ